jgi:hypothetical protein
MLRAYLNNGRLLRPTRIGSFLRSFRLHSPRYARETIAEICSMGVALATMPIDEIGSAFSALCSGNRPAHLQVTRDADRKGPHFPKARDPTRYDA